MGEYEEICTDVQYTRSRRTSRVSPGTETQLAGQGRTIGGRRKQGRKPKEYAAYAVSK